MPALSLAPDPIRCAHVLKSGHRCTRFGILLPDGSRDAGCIAHSTAEHAVELRTRSVRARQQAAAADRARREATVRKVFPGLWRSPRDFQRARLELGRLLIAGEVTAVDVREARALLTDAEMNVRVPRYEWQFPEE